MTVQSRSNSYDRKPRPSKDKITDQVVIAALRRDNDELRLKVAELTAALRQRGGQS